MSESLVSEQAVPLTLKTAIKTLNDRGHINLRGDPSDASFVEKCASILGQDLPLVANRMTVAEHHIYWLGPDEWLISCADHLLQSLVHDLESGLKSFHSSITDLSGGQVVIHLEGHDVRDVLAKGCTLDFHKREFKPLHCAQSGMAKAIAVIGKIDDCDKFEVIVRRSFYEYLISWLKHSI